MNKPTVLIAHSLIPDLVAEMLAERCVVRQCTIAPGPDREEVLRLIAGVHGLIWWPNAESACRKLDKQLLDAAGPNLRAVCTVSSGVDHIDVGEIRKRGIRLGHMAKVQDAGVADMAVLLALAASRRLHACRKGMDRGEWERDPLWLLGMDLQGATVGIVGLGHIGFAILQRLLGFQVKRFLYSGPSAKPAGDKLGAEWVPFDTLLAASDFVIAACPLTPATHHLFDAAAFAKMKRTAIFVNIARGGLVDQEALIVALRDRTIWAAGLDVVVPEPLPPDHPLLQLDNCIVMPHNGSNTIRTREAMFRLAAENILLALDGKPMRTPVALD